MSDEWLRLDQPAAYQIRVQGWVSEQWKDWLAGMTLEREGGDERSESTLLGGVVRDQAALLGLLQQLYALGFVLLEVRLVVPEPRSVRSDSGTSPRQNERGREH